MKSEEDPLAALYTDGAVTDTAGLYDKWAEEYEADLKAVGYASADRCATALADAPFLARSMAMISLTECWLLPAKSTVTGSWRTATSLSRMSSRIGVIVTLCWPAFYITLTPHPKRFHERLRVCPKTGASFFP